MTTLARLLLLPALVVTSLAATAAPVRYALDPVHTRVLFAVEHAGFSRRWAPFPELAARWCSTRTTGPRHGWT